MVLFDLGDLLQIGNLLAKMFGVGQNIVIFQI